jgi:hypothetical protein
MAVIDTVLVEVSNLVVRAAQESATPTSTGTNSPQSSTSTADDGKKDDGGGGGGGSSPLLFFVALGFGVVFTNLW